MRLGSRGLATPDLGAQVTVPAPRGAEAAATNIDSPGPGVVCFSRRQLQYWAACTPDPWVLSTLTQGYTLQFRRRPLATGRVRMTIIRDPAKAIALGQELSTLQAKGAIEHVDPLVEPRGFYSTYFLVPKKDGGIRPVLDLRGLNKFLKVLLFHMLTTAEVLRVVAPGEWFTLVALKDAYFHVPIVAHHRRFLRFAFQGRQFQFRVLPFGLSLSPRVFTRCVSAALAPLQAEGLKILPYLDDWLVCAPSRYQVARDTHRLLAHAARLGLKVNAAKSNLVPSQRVTYLIVQLDTIAMRACLSSHRVNDILESLVPLRRGKVVPYLHFLRLVGKLAAATSVVPLGLLTLRPLQRWMNALHLDAKWHRQRKVRVSQQCALSLAPWMERAFLSQGAPMGSIPSRREVVTVDACPEGWGLAEEDCTGAVVRSGRCTPHQCARVAGYTRGTQTLCVLPEGEACSCPLRQHVCCVPGESSRGDQVSTVASGGDESPDMGRSSPGWSEGYAPTRSTESPVTDFLSRHKPPPGEWQLHHEVVGGIWDRFGRAEVDLFASEEPTHCPLWFSWTEDSSPLGQDALAHEWPRVLLYAFPPLPLIWPTLQRVLQRGHKLLLVAPFWPGRTWFPLLHKLCCSSPRRLPNRRDLLSQLRGQIWHPDPGRSCLWVWPLQGPTHAF